MTNNRNFRHLNPLSFAQAEKPTFKHVFDIEKLLFQQALASGKLPRPLSFFKWPEVNLTVRSGVDDWKKPSCYGAEGCLCRSKDKHAPPTCDEPLICQGNLLCMDPLHDAQKAVWKQFLAQDNARAAALVAKHRDHAPDGLFKPNKTTNFD